MTSVVLIAVFCLITMKMSKAKRKLKKKVEPTSLFTVDKEKVELDLRNSSDSSTSNRTLNTSASTTDNTMSTLGLGSNTTGAPSLRQGTSLQTMSTQLSDESQVNYGVSNNPNYHNRRSSFQQSGRGPRTRRVPSEDCVAEEFPGREGLRQERGQVVREREEFLPRIVSLRSSLAGRGCGRSGAKSSEKEDNVGRLPKETRDER